ncbi:MAG: hypothetical protein E7774_01270 [Bradyrhizobium sp.]|nr:MAG: hypothetical protein E7774_01270 [Bradyrhizobium sp.]
MARLGLAAMICLVVLSGEAFAHQRTPHNSPPKVCYLHDVAYKPSDYCYTSCAPTKACEIELCLSTGEWMEVGACKQRDCKRVCL